LLKRKIHNWPESRAFVGATTIETSNFASDKRNAIQTEVKGKVFPV
jgi:hypothetical protein